MHNLEVIESIFAETSKITYTLLCGVSIQRRIFKLLKFQS